MARCKLCKKNITDGTEYCQDCADKKDLVTNESYLDDLLNSIQNNGTTASDIYKKKKEKQGSASSDIELHNMSDESADIDPNDLKDYDQFDIADDLDEPIVISDEELYGDETAAPEIYIDEEEQEVYDHNIDSEFLEMNESDEHSIIEDGNVELDLDDLIKHIDMAEDNDNEDDYDYAEDNNADDDNEDSRGNENYDDNVNDNDNEDSSDKENDDDNADEIDYLDNSNSEDDKQTVSQEKVSTEDELLELLNQINPEAPIEDDIQAISDLIGAISQGEETTEDYPEDVGEVFTEALEAVSGLKDYEQDSGINYIIQDSDSSTKKDKAKKKKEKKAGLFTRLFANVDDEDISSEEKRAEEEIAAAKREKKKKRKSKGKKSDAADASVEDNEETGSRRREEEEEPKDSKKEKKPKKEKKKKIEVIEEEVDKGRINKVGASIVFLFFGTLTILFLLLTNMFSYSLSIKNATDYFGRHKYTQAYNEVYGIDLKDEDIELYDKIMTIMFVNKQLNSYNCYYHMRKYPEALDSLLKGLQRYDKYAELATMLGIKTDLDYVRDQILAELYNVFGLTEEEALRIIDSENRMQYSIAVYDVVLENMLFYDYR